MEIALKRAYDEPQKEDGIRILVDRLWPRGVSKEQAHLDSWIKEVGPSTELRKWFGHEKEKFDEFEKRYKKELSEGKQEEALNELKEVVQQAEKQITLVYGAREGTYNHAAILKELLDRLYK